MTKKKIRIFEMLANVFPEVWNYPVHLIVHDGWSNYSLATCIHCGELFVIDWENPATEKLSLEQIANSKDCPKCKSKLKDTIREYPLSIRLPNGQIGSCVTDKQIPPDSSTIVVELYELRP